MGHCPVCNGLQSINQKCSQCLNDMDDQGRYMDYFDDYSAYLPIELTKRSDGISDDIRNSTCPHIVMCLSCKKEMVILIDEITT